MKIFNAKLSDDSAYAHRWDGGLDKLGMRPLIEKLVERGTIGGIKFNEGDGTHDLVIKQGADTITAHAGEWVVLDRESGSWESMDDEEFNLIYEEA